MTFPYEAIFNGSIQNTTRDSSIYTFIYTQFIFPKFFPVYQLPKSIPQGFDKTFPGIENFPQFRVL